MFVKNRTKQKFLQIIEHIQKVGKFLPFNPSDFSEN